MFLEVIIFNFSDSLFSFVHEESVSFNYILLLLEKFVQQKRRKVRRKTEESILSSFGFCGFMTNDKSVDFLSFWDIKREKVVSVLFS